ANGQYFATAEDARASFPWAAKRLSQELAHRYQWKAPQETKHERKLSVFLCHANEDKPIVRELYKRLRSAGVEPWLDEENILPGVLWKPAIEKAIAQTDAIIICLSERAVSKEGHINAEIKRGIEKAERQPEGTIFLIPLRLEPCDVPSRLQDYQWVDYFEKGGYDRLILSLWARSTFLKISPPQHPYPEHSPER